MTRHQRRKAAKARSETKLLSLVEAARAERNQRIVNANLASPRPPVTPKGLIGTIYEMGRHK